MTSSVILWPYPHWQPPIRQVLIRYGDRKMNPTWTENHRKDRVGTGGQKKTRISNNATKCPRMIRMLTMTIRLRLPRTVKWGRMVDISSDIDYARRATSEAIGQASFIFELPYMSSISSASCVVSVLFIEWKRWTLLYDGPFRWSNE